MFDAHESISCAILLFSTEVTSLQSATSMVTPLGINIDMKQFEIQPSPMRKMKSPALGGADGQGRGIDGVLLADTERVKLPPLFKG